MSDIDQQLDEMRRAWRAKARYGIYRHRVVDDGYSRVQEPLSYTGLTFDEVGIILDRLNKEARAAAGNPSDSWGLTMYNMKLETPTPSRLMPAIDQH